MPGPHYIGITAGPAPTDLVFTFSCGPDNIFDRRPAAQAQIIECEKHGKFIAMMPVGLRLPDILGNPSPVLLVPFDAVEFAHQLMN
ncbi:MAG: hypothetical protein OXC83_00500 [Chloroflexi bacterium]|nr:hypothetical protein [Chloroflexota bacterium]